MKYLLVLLIFPFLSASECGKKKNNVSPDSETSKDSIPVCVRKILNNRNKETPSNLPTQIDEYLYNGKKVFLFTAPCCDQYNTLYDENCTHICAPSGGLTGKGDRKCEDFSRTAKFVKLLWRFTK